jgi:hypothetical protein
MVAPLPLPPSRQEELQELFGDKNPYPAEDIINPPHGTQKPTPTKCDGKYGLSVGFSWVEIRCALNVHPPKVNHAAGFADGVFSWPTSAKGVSFDEKPKPT